MNFVWLFYFVKIYFWLFCFVKIFSLLSLGFRHCTVQCTHCTTRTTTVWNLQLFESEWMHRKESLVYCATTQKITSDTALLRVSWMNWGIMHSCNSPLLDYLRLCVRGFKTTLDYIGLRVHSCQTTLVYFDLHVHGCSKNNLEGN